MRIRDIWENESGNSTESMQRVELFEGLPSNGVNPSGVRQLCT